MSEIIQQLHKELTDKADEVFRLTVLHLSLMNEWTFDEPAYEVEIYDSLILKP